MKLPILMLVVAGLAAACSVFARPSRPNQSYHFFPWWRWRDSNPRPDIDHSVFPSVEIDSPPLKPEFISRHYPVLAVTSANRMIPDLLLRPNLVVLFGSPERER